MKLEKILRPIGKFCGALALATSLVSTPAFASEKYDQPNKNKDEIYKEVVLGNCVLQGLISGFGGMQNKKPYWESFAKGCLGGVLVAGGKIAVGNDLNAAWPAKLATATGTSISYNASNGKPISDSFGIDFGPAFLEWKKNELGNYKFKTYLLPDSLAYGLFFVANGGKLNVESSLRYGTPVFDAKRLQHEGDRPGISGGNNVAIVEENEVRRRFPYNDDKFIKELREGNSKHELIHTLQYSSSRSIGNVVLNTFDKSKGLKNYFEEHHIKLDNAVGYHLLHPNFLYGDESERPMERESYALTESR